MVIQVYKLSTDVAEDTALFANAQVNREYVHLLLQCFCCYHDIQAVTFVGSLNTQARSCLLQTLVKQGQPSAPPT